MPVWETLLLDAGGTLVTLGVTATAAWLAHRRGWLAKPAAALAAWLGQNAGMIGQDAISEVEALLLLHRPAPPSKAPAAGPEPLALQGDGGFGRWDLVTPPDLAPGSLVTVRHTDGTSGSYRVEGSTPAQAGVSYRLRPVADPVTDNEGVNEGDTHVPGSSRG